VNLATRIPARPVLSFNIFRLATSRCASVLDAGESRLTLNARAALAHAMLHANIGRGHSVLVPAYHCPAMVSPLAWLGIQPIFHPIRPDTSVDIDALARLVRPDTRAVIAVHYFGFIQDLRPLRQFCDARGLLLIEDCAHAFFGNIAGRPIGQYGDYAIASIMKFLPVYEGGCLVSSKRSLADLKMRHGGIFFQLKSALNALELACDHGRLPWLSYLLEAKAWAWQKLKSGRKLGDTLKSARSVGEADGEGFEFAPVDLHVSMSWFSIGIMKSMSFSLACSRRRRNYETLFDALRDIPGAKPLYPQLPEGVYPQVLPMLMDEPEKVFDALKRAGVPIIRFGEYRWQGVDESTCKVSTELSRRVFQFPCHQSLRAAELDWIIATIKSVLAESNNNGL
jgi:dTDP-4-amino-4,6-dideoxygalactose transaminase